MHLAEDETFKREGNDVIVDVQVTYSQAVLGAEVEVPTIDGTAMLTVPPGTQSHTLFKLRGKGLPSLGGVEIGDEYVRVIVKTPSKMSSEERRLVERMRELEGSSPPPKSRLFGKSK